ncbi:SCO1664 family protein [soil metagenome]
MEHPQLPETRSGCQEPDCAERCDGTAAFRQYESFMRRAVIEDCELVPWGSNYTFAVLLSDPAGEQEEALAIYKPAAGEIPLWDFPDDTLYHREYAAYLVSQRLEWRFIPPTIIRDGPHGTGSVQQFIEPEEEAHYFSFREDHREDLQRIALFDIITNNADRKAGHTLRSAHDGRIWGIDHGLTFNVEPKLRTVIWDFQLEPISRQLRQDIRRIAGDQALAQDLAAHLTDNEIRAFQIRASRLARTGVFPPLTSRRSIPWGW